jgi:hypothetical protein
MDSAVTPLGPLLSADRIFVTTTGADKVPYQLEIFPDANNVLLQQNGLPQQYYFMPQRIYVAKRQDDPADFDFGMTVFKGLMTSEDTIGVNPGQGTGSGDVEAGGGFCTFSTTFAIPPDVLQNATNALKTQKFDGPIPGGLALFMPPFRQNEVDPILGIVPILANAVSIFVFQNPPASGGSAPPPIWMSAQSAQKGSIEATGISSFLVSCNELAAGLIAGSLKAGTTPPFTVNYQLTEQFYLPTCEVDVIIDMDKTYESFSVAVDASGLFTNFSFSAAWSECVTNGSISTVMKIDEAAIPDDLKKIIMDQCQQMQTNAINWVKDFIFDWNPTDSGDAQASPTPFGSIFGGASVSMKLNYQKRAMHVTQTLTLDTSIAMTDGKQGDLSDLMPAVKADVNKYLAIIDIGQFFQKIQVAATNAINWNETLPDGTNLSDPIMSAMVSVSYPDYDQPLAGQNNVNLKTLGQGYHYITGQQTGTDGLAQWSSKNPADVINISFLKLDNPISQWPSDQVQVTKTLIFDGNDPRVDLTNNETQYVVTTTDNNHTPVLDMNAVGYVLVRFACRPLPAAVTLVVNTTLGARKDSVTITSANQKSAIWEIFSDKYVGETSFQYTVQVTVQGPNFTDDPIVYQTDQAITVPLPPGRVKYNPLLSLQLPDAPSDQVAAINQYILNYQREMLSGTLT